MKILIVSYFYPPFNTIASHRPYSFARSWAQQGHEVTVMTSQECLGRPNALNLPPLDVEVIYQPHLNPLRRWMSSDGRPAQPSAHPTLKETLRARFEEYRNRTGVLTTIRLPNYTDPWILPALKTLFGRSRGAPWDLAVTTFSPAACHVIGAVLKRRGRAKVWIADFRDPFTDSPLFTGVRLLHPLERALERHFVTQADVVTTVSGPLASALSRRHGRRVEVVENGFDPDAYGALPTARIFPDDGLLRLVYTGTLYQNIQDPGPLLKAVRLLKERGERATLERLELRFVGIAPSLSEALEREGVGEWVRFGGAVSREDALRMQRDADGLLFFNCPPGIMSGKVYEYLNASAPILVMGPWEPGSPGALIETCGAGLYCGQKPEQIAAALRSFANGEMRVVRDAAAIGRFDRRKLAERMLAMGERALASRDVNRLNHRRR